MVKCSATIEGGERFITSVLEDFNTKGCHNRYYHLKTGVYSLTPSFSQRKNRRVQYLSTRVGCHFSSPIVQQS